MSERGNEIMRYLETEVECLFARTMRDLDRGMEAAWRKFQDTVQLIREPKENTSA